MSEVIGAGVVLEVQAALEKARNQWSRNMTVVRKEELDPLLQQLARLNDSLGRLALDQSPEMAHATMDSNRLFDEAKTIIGTNRLSTVQAPNTPSDLDRLLKEISTERAVTERELSTIRALLNETQLISSLSIPEDASMQELQDRVALLSTQVLQNEETMLRERELGKQRLIQEQDRANRLSTFAQLALEELGDTCPVCQQTYDRPATQAHLAHLVEASLQTVETSRTHELAMTALEQSRRTLQRDLDSARSQLQQANSIIQEANARRSVYAARLDDLGLANDQQALDKLTARAQLAEERLSKITKLTRLGDELTVSIVRLAELRRRSELTQEKARLEPQLAETSSKLDRMDKTHALAGRHN